MLIIDNIIEVVSVILKIYVATVNNISRKITVWKIM